MTTTFDSKNKPSDGGLRVARPTFDDITPIHNLGKTKISANIATLDTFRRVHRRNTDSLWGVYANDEALVGFFAFLMLTSDGADRLVSGSLNTRAPDMDAIAVTGEAPEAVYVWALVAENKVVGALPLVLSAFDAAVYARTDLYARPATEGGYRLMSKIGFRSVDGGPIERDELCVIRRSVAPTQIRYPGRSQAAHAFL